MNAHKSIDLTVGYKITAIKLSLSLISRKIPFSLCKPENAILVQDYVYVKFAGPYLFCDLYQQNMIYFNRWLEFAHLHKKFFVFSCLIFSYKFITFGTLFSCGVHLLLFVYRVLQRVGVDAW